MKKKLIALVLLLTLALTFGLIACNKDNNTGNEPPVGPYAANQTAYAFATTFNGSHAGLAFVTVSTDKHGYVTTAHLNEAFIPNEWARLSADDAAQLGTENTVTTGTVLYPKYIELTINGTAKVYEGKRVTCAANTGTDKAYDKSFTWTIDTAGTAIRYYETTAAGTASTKTGNDCLEGKLSTDKEFALGYITMFRGYELAPGATTNKNCTDIKYFKGTTKVDTARYAARKTYSATASTGAIGIGAPMKSSADAELTGSSLAYASTFFKRDSDYQSRQKYLSAPADTALTQIPNGAPGWSVIDAYYHAFVVRNLDVLTVDKAFALAKDSADVPSGFKNGNLVTNATSFHANIYITLYVVAYGNLQGK